MKLLKKSTGFILAMCLMVPMFGSVAFAADGVLMFSDPTTQVGENFSVDLVVQSSSGESVGDVNVTMSYDPEALEFVSGDGFTVDDPGTLTYTGTGSSEELRSTAEFRALQSGTASISVDDSSATVASGEDLDLELGSSSVTVEAADDGSTTAEPSETADTPKTTDIVVDVNGTQYNFSEAFTSQDIPTGFSETTASFNGEDRKFVKNDGDILLGYLVDSNGAGKFFRYNKNDETFSPFVEISVSDTTSLILMDDASAVSLPDNYQEVSLTVQDQQFPAWSDPDNDRYYIIYAMNTRTGENSLYQYDTEDGTYQYFEASNSDTQTAQGNLPGVLGKFVQGHLALVLILLVIVILIFLILMLVFGIKLIHRNQELDDLYDEYDIPYDDDNSDKKVKEDQSAPQYDDDDFEDSDDDDDYDNDDYDDYEDDDYEDEDYEDEDDDYEDDDYEDDGYEDDDYDDEPDNEKKKKSSSNDDYDINFVDL